MNKKVLFIITGMILLAASLTVGGVWYEKNQQIKKQRQGFDSQINDLKNKIQILQGKATRAIDQERAGFDKVVAAGAEIYYPKKWGKAVVKKSNEEIEESLGSGNYFSFSGQSIEFGADRSANLIDAQSYLKDNTMRKDILLLKKVYEEKKVSMEEVKSADENKSDFGSLPYPEMYKVTIPQYIENATGNWRGYWMLGNSSHQAPGMDPYFIAVMYNKENDEVFSIFQSIKSLKSEQVNSSIDVYNTDLLSLHKYLQTAYTDDLDVRTVVDNELLMVCELIK